ncbi:hypothetical protein R3P38DRAFT_3136749 [Favolaschia claudopus]|uniref:Uncharacterized protein n=1 Tax=Favolaschia claudopus TaxID=2862362 RepID=A0AAV9Z7U5_9AGAR
MGVWWSQSVERISRCGTWCFCLVSFTGPQHCNFSAAELTTLPNLGFHWILRLMSLPVPVTMSACCAFSQDPKISRLLRSSITPLFRSLAFCLVFSLALGCLTTCLGVIHVSRCCDLVAHTVLFISQFKMSISYSSRQRPVGVNLW